MARFCKWPKLGQRASVAILVAMAAPVLAAAIGLGVEISAWTVMVQGLQRTADVAAIAAAAASSGGATEQSAAIYGAYVAELNNAAGASTTRTWTALTHSLADNTITILKTSGVVSTTDTAFKATVQVNTPFVFSSYLSKGTKKSLKATAIAELIPSQTGRYCVLALDPTAATGFSTAGLSVSGGATLDLNQCGVQVNAVGSYALDVTGGATLLANAVAIVGGYSVSAGSTMTVKSGSAVTGAAPGANPYQSVIIPIAATTCATNSFVGGITATISPGTFCNGLTISNGSTITMTAGTYIVSNGPFVLTGGATLKATAGVTIVLTGSTAGNIGTARIDGGTTLNLTAPTSGSTSGIAIIQDSRATPPSIVNTIAGGATMNVTGALVFPSQIVAFSNGSASSSSCTQLIAYQVQFTGGAKFGNNCGGTGTSGIGPSTSGRLVQ